MQLNVPMLIQTAIFGGVPRRGGADFLLAGARILGIIDFAALEQGVFDFRRQGAESGTGTIVAL